MKTKLLAAAGILGLTAATALPVHATNGYFSHGYGTKNKGLAGGGIALPQDAMAAATNPAGMAFVGTRVDLGAAVFSPRRGYGAPATNAFPVSSPDGTNIDSDKEWFLIPHFAANYMLDQDRSVGVSVYGNGGMNTTYDPEDTRATFGTFGAGSDVTTGVDLMQLFVNLSYAQKVQERASIGASLIFAAQRFEARGFDQFGVFSTDPDRLSHKGKDYSYGGGAKIGAQVDVTDGLSLAGSYQSRIYMSEFDKYRGLFAEQGDFDIPPTATIGLAWRATPKSTFILDVQKTWFSKIDSVGNPMSRLSECNWIAGATNEQCLGGTRGAGFGWDDVTVYKLGYQWEASSDWTWRVGYSRTEQPITNDNVLFNVVAPAVMEEHYTVGFTKQVGKTNELSFAAFYAPEVTVHGDGGPFFAGMGFTPEDSVEIYMKQFEVELSWAWKFD